jgi:hypothetical protein
MLLLDYSYIILLDYINVILLKFKGRFLLTKVGNPNLYNKQLQQYKKKRRKKFNKLFLSAFNILIEFKKKLLEYKKLKEKNKKAKIKIKIKKVFLINDEIEILEKCLKKILKRNKINFFICFFKKLRKKIKFLFKHKLRDTSCDAYFIHKINRLEKRHYMELGMKIYNRKTNIRFVDFFFYIAKKVGFQKIRNSFSLKKK